MTEVSLIPTASEAAEAVQYDREKFRFQIVRFLYGIALLLAMVYESDKIGELARWLAPDIEWLQLPLVYMVLTLISVPIELLLAYYGGYVLEQRYELSTQTRAQFWIGYIKDLGFNGSIVLASLVIFFLALQDPNHWWLYNAAGVTVLILVVATVIPIYITKRHEATPLDDVVLVGRLQALAERFGMNISKVLQYRISLETRKANAFLGGMGRTKGVWLADTLIAALTLDELEVVMLHELGHYKLRHQLRMLVVMPLVMLASFYACHQGLVHLAPAMGYSSFVAPEAQPLFQLVLTITNALAVPLVFFFIRLHEEEADRFALDNSKKPDAFINAFHKLARLNKSPEAMPWWRIIFTCDHPTFADRITAAENWKLKRARIAA